MGTIQLATLPPSVRTPPTNAVADASTQEKSINNNIHCKAQSITIKSLGPSLFLFIIKQIVYNLIIECQSGEIGRRAVFRRLYRKVCGFESHLWHQ